MDRCIVEYGALYSPIDIGNMPSAYWNLLHFVWGGQGTFLTGMDSNRSWSSFYLCELIYLYKIGPRFGSNLYQLVVSSLAWCRCGFYGTRCLWDVLKHWCSGCCEEVHVFLR